MTSLTFAITGSTESFLHSRIWAPDKYCQNNSAIKEELVIHPAFVLFCEQVWASWITDLYKYLIFCILGKLERGYFSSSYSVSEE